MDYGAKRETAADERRSHERFLAPDGAWAAVRPFSRSNPRGQIVDIGKGGLAFCYAVPEEEPEITSELDICFSECGFCLRRARFAAVSDVQIMNANVPHSRPVHRLGVAFLELTSEQRLQLEYFIEHHTLGKV